MDRDGTMDETNFLSIIIPLATLIVIVLVVVIALIICLKRPNCFLRRIILARKRKSCKGPNSASISVVTDDFSFYTTSTLTDTYAKSMPSCLNGGDDDAHCKADGQMEENHYDYLTWSEEEQLPIGNPTQTNKPSVHYASIDNNDDFRRSKRNSRKNKSKSVYGNIDACYSTMNCDIPSKSESLLPTLHFQSNELQKRSQETEIDSRRKVQLLRPTTFHGADNNFSPRRMVRKKSSLYDNTRSIASNDSGFCSDSCSTCTIHSRVHEPAGFTISTEQVPVEQPIQKQIGCTDDELQSFIDLYKQKSKLNVGMCFCDSLIALGTFDSEGGILHNETKSAVMNIPPGALQDTTTIYFAIMYDTDDMDNSGYGSLSPSFECGPDGTKFNKPVTLRFSHCYGGDAEEELVHLVSSEGLATWDENVHSDISLLDDGYATMTFDHFSRHRLGVKLSRSSRIPVPRSPNRHSKKIFICSFVNLSRNKLNVYYLNRDIDLYERLKKIEIENGSSVESLPNPLTFKQAAGGLVFQHKEERRMMSEMKIMEERFHYFEFAFYESSISVEIYQQNSSSDRIYIHSSIANRPNLVAYSTLLENAYESKPKPVMLGVAESEVLPITPVDSMATASLSPSSDYSTLQFGKLPVESCDCPTQCQHQVECQFQGDAQNQPRSDMLRGARERRSTESGYSSDNRTFQGRLRLINAVEHSTPSPFSYKQKRRNSDSFLHSRNDSAELEDAFTEESNTVQLQYYTQPSHHHFTDV